jgi:hypothetical protein
MKLLVIGKPKDAVATLAPALIRQLFETSLNAIRQQKKEGKVLEAYYSPVGCSVAILDYKGADEWVKDQTSVPILRYYDWEVYPLADFDESMKGILEGLKAAENMVATTAK